MRGNPNALGIALVAAVFATVSVSAVAASAKANWTETFTLKGGGWVKHTPTYVTFDGFITAGKELQINGLDVKTDSSREEFIEALIRSRLYPA